MKKYLMFFWLIFFSNILLLAQNPPFNGNGDGSLVDPFQIWSLTDWKEFEDSLNSSIGFPSVWWQQGKHFRLMQNRDDSIRQTAGGLRCHFYCNWKKVTLAITFNYPSNPFSVLFSGLSNGGTLDSLIVDGYISEAITSSVGSFSGISIMSYCINNATITSPSVAAGIAYSNSGIISHCINNGSVSGSDRIGGIVGTNSGQIISCINTGKIIASNSGSGPNGSGGIGGIVGVHSPSSVSNSINLGTVEGQDKVGGIAGLGVSSITNSINCGYIKGINEVGGIVGASVYFQFLGSISNSLNTGVIEGEEDVGAIVGKEP